MTNTKYKGPYKNCCFPSTIITVPAIKFEALSKITIKPHKENIFSILVAFLIPDILEVNLYTRKTINPAQR